MSIQVELETETSLWVYPYVFLGNQFAIYTKIVKAEGGKYVDTKKRYRISIANIERLRTALEAEGFPCRLSLPTLRTIQDYQETQKTQVEETKDRALQIDATLQAKGLRLYPYQELGAKKLTVEESHVLGDDPGLGKSIETLMAVSKNSPLIVVCPAIAKGVWEDEAAKWRPDLTPVILEGHGSFRWPEPGEMLVLNYDILPPIGVDLDAVVDVHALAEKKLEYFKTSLAKRGVTPTPELQQELTRLEVKIAKAEQKIELVKSQLLPTSAPRNITLVADEAHMLKGKSLRSRRFTALGKLVREYGGKTWGLTGTPLLNQPQELWRVLQAFDLHLRAFESYPTFTSLFGGVPGEYGGMSWGAVDPSVPERLKKVMLRRRRADVLPQLPEKTWRYLRIPLDQITKSLCDEAYASLQAHGINLTDAQDLVKATRRGAWFEVLAAARKAMAAMKVPLAEEFVEQLEEQEEPLLVFASHRAPVEIIGNRKGWACITGDTNEAQRTQISRDFQEGKYKGIALTIQAGGTALTLTRAAQILFIDRLWTPALNAQAEDRTVRHGQTRGVVITILEAKHALDYRVNQLLVQKQELIASALGER